MAKYDLFIDGEWVQGESYFENLNPSNIAEVVGEYAEASSEQVETAVQAAARALPEWSDSTPQQRFQVLDAVGSEILARKNELGRLLSREEGKTLAEGVGEVVRAGQIFKFFAGEALRLQGEHLPSVRPGVEVDVLREPVGVVGLITPWNFPVAIPAWKVAPALAYGNTVVLKPSEKAPASGWALAEILSRTGLPAGVFNLVMGRGQKVGEPLVNHPNVAAVSFTGSLAVGQRVAAACAKRQARVQLEMGGKNPLVVLDDADLDTAVACAVNGAFYSTGQRCTASSRLIVTEGIHDRFVERMLQHMQTLRVGDALDELTDIGPVIDEAQMQKNLHYIELAEKEGARRVFGGERLQLDKNGYYMSPALFVDTTNEMRINREEVFGPVACVIRVRNYEEALAVANDTRFGLSAGICTTSLKYAHDFRNRVKAGLVMINLPTAGVDYHVPFGGMKGSSYGPREQGAQAREFYTQMKTCYTQFG